MSNNNNNDVGSTSLFDIGNIALSPFISTPTAATATATSSNNATSVQQSSNNMSDHHLRRRHRHWRRGRSGDRTGHPGLLPREAQASSGCQRRAGGQGPRGKDSEGAGSGVGQRGWHRGGYSAKL